MMNPILRKPLLPAGWAVLALLCTGLPAQAGTLPGKTGPATRTAAAQVTVTGRITDEKNQPLPGATVIAKGTTGGTATNSSGEYSITVAGPQSVLIFSYVGYLSQEVTVGSKPVINIQLAPDLKQLTEVVVTGYGTLSKREVTSSIASIKPEEFNRGVVVSPAQLLQGKVAGLNITRSGDPNGTPSVTLRGPSTLREGSAQQPFYVIDGVPDASIDLIPPDDIVSIDVLRDASATAIYGARAANGVIIVTTKRAKSGQSQLTYSGYTALEQVSNRIDVLTGDEIRAYLKANGKTLAPADEDNVNTDWQKEVMRSPISHSHTISFQGGNNNTLYGASVNYLDNPGVLKGSSRERTIIRANVQHSAFNNRLRLDLSVGNTFNTAKTIPYGVYENMVRYLPTVNVRNADGTFKENFGRGNSNPVSLIESITENRKTKTFMANGKIQAEILPNLFYNANLAIQDEQINYNYYANRYAQGALTTGGIAIRSSYANTKKIIESYFNYDKQFGNHDLKVLAGYSWQQDRQGDGFQTSTRGFVSDALLYNNLGLSSPPTGFVPDFGTTVIKTLRLISYYGRINYQYNDKYQIQASVRRDGSSAFGKNNQWGLFPTVSAGWQISKEPFMANVTAFSDLKLRVGYGVTGNSLGFDPFVSILRYGSTGRFYYNGSYINGVGPTQNENPDLKWEKTAMLNVGLDFGILKGRVTGSLEYYDKLTSDLIWTYPVSTTQYFVSTLTANAGKMSNKGVELTLSTTPIKTGRFTWRSNLNLAHNVNKITTLSNDKFTLNFIRTAFVGGRGQSGNSSQIVKEGLAIGTFNLWQYAGKNEKGISQFKKADGTLTTSPTSDDFVIGGNAQPKLIYGWNNSFTVGNFDLNVFVRGVTGNKILNASLAQLNGPSDANSYNQARIVLDEPFADINSYLVSSRYLENGSYLRLDNATLGYTIKTGAPAIRNLRVYVTASNLFVITKYRGIDPEMNLGGITPGIDNNNFYPKTRSFVLGANITF
ncbi:SusC/RagA family TonB-linked outer membrane protein [Larkinella terrae]|nr:TonB-dependent receptor [Larkinella terrae]